MTLDRNRARQLIAKTKVNMKLYDEEKVDPRTQNAIDAAEQWLAKGLTSVPLASRRRIIIAAFEAAAQAKTRRARWVAQAVAWTVAIVGEIDTTTRNWIMKNNQNRAEFNRWRQVFTKAQLA